tara:strand:- start:443 stop:619 length:177 start_codon:yes stop_codon:yes gene_type:complete
MKKYEVLVDIVESHVLTIEAIDEFEAEDVAESDGCDNEPHNTEVKVVSIKEVNDEYME